MLQGRLISIMRFVGAFVLILVIVAGCGKGLPVAPASGTVMLDGKPLVGASITTQPIATDSRNPGPGSFGRTDDQGHFELELVNPSMKGAIIGEHRVMISPATGEPAASEAKQSGDGPKQWTDTPTQSATANNWPTKFADGSLTLQVPAEGTSELRLNLDTSNL